MDDQSVQLEQDSDESESGDRDALVEAAHDLLKGEARGRLGMPVKVSVAGLDSLKATKSTLRVATENQTDAEVTPFSRAKEKAST